MKTSLKFLSAIAALFTFCSSQAALITLNPTGDAFVTTGPTGNLSGNNYGSAGALAIAAPGESKGEFQSVMQFDLSSAYNSLNTLYGVDLWTVQSVTLQLTATSGGNPIFNSAAAGQFNISLMQNNSWVAGTGTPAAPTTSGITYNNLQSTYINNALDQNLGTFSFAGGSSGANTYSLTLSSGLIADLMNGSKLSLRPNAADSSVSYLFNSEDFGTAGSRPVLTINAIPEPGSLALGGLGFVLAAGWHRHFRRTKG
jgi:hypothetical protein